MKEYPLDVRGIILHVYDNNREYRWVAPLEFKSKIEYDNLELSFRQKKKIADLISVDGASRGPVIPRAICTAARQGRIALASTLCNLYLRGHVIMPELLARARLLISDEKRRVRSLLNVNREWPKGVWNLQDVPAWIIPAFIIRYRQLVSNEALKLISGGHLLAVGEWVWKVPKNSNIAKINQVLKP